MTLASASDPANGTVVLTGGLPGAHTGLTYQPDPNYCNNPPGTTPDTFTYTLNGGSTATVTVTVDCVDDSPVAVNDSATTAQNSAPIVIDVLANDTDIDGGPKEIMTASDPANGTVIVANDGLSLTYQPDANYCNDGNPLDTFTYTLNGGSAATVSVTVLCDIPPVANNDAATVLEDSGANAINVLANDFDPNCQSISVGSFPGSTPNGGTVSASGDNLVYTPSARFIGQDTFAYTVRDAGGASSTATVTVDVQDYLAPESPAPVGLVAGLQARYYYVPPLDGSLGSMPALTNPFRVESQIVTLDYLSGLRGTRLLVRLAPRPA